MSNETQATMYDVESMNLDIKVIWELGITMERRYNCSCLYKMEVSIVGEKPSSLEFIPLCLILAID